MSSKKSSQETTSEQNSAKSYAAGDQANQSVMGDMGYYSGDPGQSALYKSLMTTGTDATNNAYNDAKAANKLHGNVAGFGYTSPVAQASDAGVENARASDLSALPAKALQTSIGDQLAAEGLKAGVGSSYLGNQVGNMNASVDAYKTRSQNSLWNSILGAGASLGGTAMKVWGG